MFDVIHDASSWPQQYIASLCTLLRFFPFILKPSQFFICSPVFLETLSGLFYLSTFATRGVCTCSYSSERI
ncbi:uncharacterized protein J3R85_018635 [Psidium guajava]|nr:uncharacterized protein J3R85_018635 [Psidium guajava]